MVGNLRLMTSVLQRIFYAVRLAMAVAIGAVSLPAQADNAIPMFIGDDGYLSQTVEGIRRCALEKRRNITVNA